MVYRPLLQTLARLFILNSFATPCWEFDVSLDVHSFCFLKWHSFSISFPPPWCTFAANIQAVAAIIHHCLSLQPSSMLSLQPSPKGECFRSSTLACWWYAASYQCIPSIIAAIIQGVCGMLQVIRASANALYCSHHPCYHSSPVLKVIYASAFHWWCAS